jgi:hypothetical protein
MQLYRILIAYFIILVHDSDIKVTALTHYLLIFFNVRHFLFIAVQWVALLLHLQEIPGSNPNPRIAILTALLVSKMLLLK